jgi:hypothetical protein
MVNPLMGIPGMSSMPDGLQMAMPFLLPGLMSSITKNTSMMPGSFMGTQNYYDQLRATQFQSQQFRAMSMGQQQDQRQMQQMMMGMNRMVQGRHLTIQEQQQMGTMASQMQGALPIMSMLFGTSTIDQMFGRRGSATLMAHSMHRALRHQRDPVTGAPSTSGDSAGAIASDIFSQLYGPGANISEMRGMGAGQAGMLFEQMQQRGLIGGRTPQDRMRAMQNMEFSQAQRQRIIRSTLRSQGRAVNEENIAEMEESIFTGDESTLSRVRAGEVDRRGLSEMAGGEAMLRAGDANRISGKLKNMAGAVNAMREIFGDRGRPNAPMAEIMNALDALTQGQLANMSPANAERLVRTSRNLAQQSGLGMQGLANLQGQIGQELSARGGAQIAAPFLTQQAAAMGVAYQNMGMGSIRGQGALSRQEAVLLEGRLGAGAASSTAANNQFAIVRMAQELGAALPEDSKLARVAKALSSGAETVTYKEGGQDVTERISDMFFSKSFVGEMGEAAGIDRTVVDSFISNRIENLNISSNARENIIRGVRNNQTKDLDLMLGKAFSQPLRTFGITGLDDDARMRIGLRTLEQSRGMSVDDFRDVETRRDIMKTNLREAILAETAPENRAAVEAQLTDAALEQMVAQQENRASINIQHDRRTAGMKSFTGYWMLNNDEIKRQRRSARFHAENTARVQSAFSAIGKATPIQRIADAMRSGRPDTSILEVVGEGLGFIKEDELKQLTEGPLGAITSLESLASGSKTLTGEDMYKDGAITDAGIAFKNMLAQQAEGMQAGGDTARDALDSMAKNILGEDGTPEKLETHIKSKIAGSPEGSPERKRWEQLQRIFSFTKGAADSGNTITKVIDKIGGDEKFALGMQVSSSDIDKARAFAASGLDSSTKKEDIIRSANTINQSMERMAGITATIGTSAADLEQLGMTGYDALQDLEGDMGKLHAEAKDAGMSVGDYVRSNPEGRKIYERVLGHMDKLSGFKESGRVRHKLSAAGKERQQQFFMDVARFRTGQELNISDEARKKQGHAGAVRSAQASTAAERLMEDKAGLGLLADDTTKKALTEQFRASGQSIDVISALSAEDRLAEIALDQGMFGKDIESLSQLSGKERAAGIQKLLKDKSIKGPLKKEISKYAEDSQVLRDIRSAGSQEDKMRAIERFRRDSGAGDKAAAESKRELWLKGELKITEDNRAIVNAKSEDTGDESRESVQTAPVGQPR